MKSKAIVVDLDGSVYYGNKIIDRVDEAINLLDRRYNVVFLTNNSTLSREDYARKLENFGISCSKYQIITSGYASAKYIKKKYEGSRVYVIGEKGLKDELIKQNIKICESNCNIVLVGLDRDFTYKKMTKALNFILEGAVFIATNTDPFLITDEGIIPGTGALISSIEIASGKKAIVTGKPSKFMIDLILNELKVKPKEILIVGDKLETDILMGIEGGMRTALVLTGASKMNDIEKTKISPDYVFKSIIELPAFLDKNLND